MHSLIEAPTGSRVILAACLAQGILACAAERKPVAKSQPVELRGPIANLVTWRPRSLALCAAQLDSASVRSVGAGAIRCVTRDAIHEVGIDLSADTTVLRVTNTWNVDEATSDSLFEERARVLTSSLGSPRRCGTNHLIWSTGPDEKSALVRWALPALLQPVPGTWQVLEHHTLRAIEPVLWCDR
ncbi:MAG: hypothetical protein U0132_19955 [Gemmatimonadaceae bacterium]